MTSIDPHFAQSQHRSVLGRIASLQTFWVFVAAVLACLFLTFATDAFATERNLFNVARNFAFVAIIAIGMTAVIASGGIDLSVGSTVVLSAMVISVLMEGGSPFWLSAAAALGAALLVGLINGVLIAHVGMPAFVVTLGMLSAARSLAMVLSNNKMIWEFGPDHDLLLWIGGGATFGLPHPLYVLLVLMFVTSFAFRWTRWGQHLFAIGGNEQAAILTGIPVKAMKVSIYMFSALTAGSPGS
jgi:ribose transport system permease protein